MLSVDDKLLEDIDEEILEEIYRAEAEIMERTRKRKKPYPSNIDLVRTIVEAVKLFHGHPNDFVDYVLELLENKGFDVRHVTVKRIWRLYEMLVRKGVISDKLRVVY